MKKTRSEKSRDTVPLTKTKFLNTPCNPPIKELRGLSHNFQIHVSVSDLYISSKVHIFSCSRIGRPIVGIYVYIAHRHINVGSGTEACNSFSGNICFEFLILCLCSVSRGIYGIGSGQMHPFFESELHIVI